MRARRWRRHAVNRLPHYRVTERVTSGIARVQATGKTKSGKSIGRPSIERLGR